MDKLGSFVGHVLRIEGLFIEKTCEVTAPAFEEEGVERLSGDACDPAEV
jgi:hypothetical protein